MLERYKENKHYLNLLIPIPWISCKSVMCISATICGAFIHRSAFKSRISQRHRRSRGIGSAT